MENRKLNLKRFCALRNILETGKSLDLDLSETVKKLEKVIETISSGEVNIALIGSFSDGKTSAIAGLLGEVLSNMKIAADESSDEITIYLYHTQEKKFRIVDTPGLFGTKEKEIEGKDIRFSDITIKYLSEAHIIIYVCDAVNPLKDSHVDTIKYIMQDLNKLASAIFVINKMDEAGYDLTDEVDFNRGKRIKMDTLKNRIKESLSLSEEQADDLNIVCIAADPNGKGIENWLTKLEEYVKRSHINDFKETLSKIISNINIEGLNLNVEYASIKDILIHLNQQMKEAISPKEKVKLIWKNKISKLENDINSKRTNLNQWIKRLTESLDMLKNNISRNIKDANYETIERIIEEDLGADDNKVSMSILKRNIIIILSDYFDPNSNKIFVKPTDITYEEEEDFSLIKDQIIIGADWLREAKINGDDVKKTRDTIYKKYKFKPWEAQKKGMKATTLTNRTGDAIKYSMKAKDIYDKYKMEQKCKRIKNELLSAVKETFSSVQKEYLDGENFYKICDPEYLELKKTLEQSKFEYNTIEQEVKKLRAFENEIKLWANDGESIEALRKYL